MILHCPQVGPSLPFCLFLLRLLREVQQLKAARRLLPLLTRRLVKEVVVARLARRVTPFWFFFSLLLGVVVFIEERTCAETPVFRFVGCRSCQKSLRFLQAK